MWAHCLKCDIRHDYPETEEAWLEMQRFIHEHHNHDVDCYVGELSDECPFC